MIHYNFRCWLNVDKGFIWSFVGPVAVVMLVSKSIFLFIKSTVVI